ncbi:uncharacterized protein LOC110850835 [Folsomia candida]|uniref:uncharacterized protein LOC110850835 n=1 Tax=Folsomia candida TaxID=158441 RepID=UPI000B8F457D|nr:uncharacterized protein LOC110850835 [Folsomia candida]
MSNPIKLTSLFSPLEPMNSNSVVPSSSSEIVELDNEDIEEVIPPKRRLIFKDGKNKVKYVFPDGVKAVVLASGKKIELTELIVSESPDNSQEDENWLPPKGAMLAVFYAIKSHLEYNGKDSAMDSTPQFLKLMKSLPISGTSTLMTKGKKATPIKINGNEVFIKWKDGTVWFNEQTARTKTKWYGARKKCKTTSCWTYASDVVNAVCVKHLIRPRELLLIWDKLNETTTIAMFHPNFKVSTSTDKWVNSYLSASNVGKREVWLTKYSASREEYEFTILKSWQSVNSTQTYHNYSIALGILVLLHNMKVNGESHKIKYCTRLIHFHEADWGKVLKILNLNGVSFRIGEKDESIDHKKCPLLPPGKKFSPTQPHTYQGWDKKGGYYDGLSLSKRKSFKGNGSKDHRRVKTTMRGVKDEDIVNVYQLPAETPFEFDDDDEEEDLNEEEDEDLNDEEDEDLNEEEDEDLNDEEDEDLNDEEDEEEDMWSEKKRRAKHAECIGFLATMIATMMGVERDGFVIHPMTKIWPFFNTVFDLDILLDIFKFKTQCSLEIVQDKMLEMVDGKLNVIWCD